MTDHCCKDMRSFTRTREEFEQSEAGKLMIERGLDPADIPEPLIRYEPKFGYTLGYAVISYCPWCGTQLPRIPLEKLMAEGITISVDADGRTYWNGELVRDHDELWARLKKERPE